MQYLNLHNLSRHQHGFTLIELSVVLVVLALLTGGILGGQALISAAELRAVATEHSKFTTAIHAFDSKYDALPGDMKDATSYWGNAQNGGTGGECTFTYTAYTDGRQTCNGDNNGIVENDEAFRFWQHLANAGLIEGTYTGTQGSAGATHWEIGVNAPPSAAKNAGWSSLHTSTGASILWSYMDVPVEAVYLGGQDPTNITRVAVFSSSDLWSIDKKMDDGKPGTGLLRTRLWDPCSTATARTQHPTAEYDLQTNTLCTAVFFDMY